MSIDIGMHRDNFHLIIINCVREQLSQEYISGYTKENGHKSCLFIYLFMGKVDYMCHNF